MLVHVLRACRDMLDAQLESTICSCEAVDDIVYSWDTSSCY